MITASAFRKKWYKLLWTLPFILRKKFLLKKVKKEISSKFLIRDFSEVCCASIIRKKLPFKVGKIFYGFKLSLKLFKIKSHKCKFDYVIFKASPVTRFSYLSNLSIPFFWVELIAHYSRIIIIIIIRNSFTIVADYGNKRSFFSFEGRESVE